MNRLFTFGCSFTSYEQWPTWADIVARNFKHFQNWGRGGAGNSFIFNSLVECHKRNSISKDDTVMIMWTNIGREDRYVNGEWLTPGSIYNQTLYDKEFVQNYADHTGYLIRDMAHLTAAKLILESIGCKYHFFSTVPFDVPDDNLFKRFTIDGKISNLYKDELSSVKPSVYETVFDFDWYSRAGYKDHVELKRFYTQVAGHAWPSWDEFMSNVTIDPEIYREMDEKYNVFNLAIKMDSHPIPIDYLDYLQLVLPEITFDNQTKDWVNEVSDQILSGRVPYTDPPSVTRF
jgi:hypothetical protein